MDVAQILRQLWRRRLWMLVGVVLAALVGLSIGWHLSLAPPKLRSKSIAVHTAETSVLIDAQQSVLADIGAPATVLTQLATVYARLMTTTPVRQAIAQRAGLPVDSLVTEASLPLSTPDAVREPIAAQRSQKLLGEKIQRTLDFRADPGFPIVMIVAQAATVPEAIKLADAGALGFADYVRHVEAARHTPLPRRVVVKQLGLATGGTVGKSAKKVAVVAAFVGVMIAWSLLVLLVSNVAEGWRRLDEPDAA
jgi:hypothetical protein